VCGLNELFIPHALELEDLFNTSKPNKPNNIITEKI